MSLGSTETETISSPSDANTSVSAFQGSEAEGSASIQVDPRVIADLVYELMRKELIIHRERTGWEK